MPQQPKKSFEWLLMNLIFGGFVAYLLFGAATGDLYIPSKSGGTGSHLSGAPAWAYVVAFSSLWLGVAIREGLFNLKKPKRTILEFTFLIFGVGLLFYVPYLYRQAH